jgi:hypothetical protein
MGKVRKKLEKLHKKVQKKEIAEARKVRIGEKSAEKKASKKGKKSVKIVPPKKGDIKEVQDLAKKQISDEFEAEDRKVDKSEVISAKKVVYIEIDDEVTNVYDKVKNLKIKHIYLVVPRRAVLFQSIVNLKILKRKAEEDGKALYLITNDKNGIYLAQQIGLSVYDKVSTEGKPIFFSTDEEDEKLRITPLKATVNSVIDEAPTRRTERKLSISEILRESASRKKMLGVKRLGESTSMRSKKLRKSDDDPKKIKKEEKIRKHKLVLVAPNKQALVGLAAISVLILMVIFYIALPGATLYLTPAASVLEKSVNVTLAEYDQNKSDFEAGTPHTIASHKVVAKVDRKVTWSATGKKLSANSSNASGTITIVNNAGYEWPLVEQTRFQTNEGVVFRITGAVNVPAASGIGPGTVDAYVVADSEDAYGQIVGARGNIGPANFFLPGLKESSRSVLFAESGVDMSGGVTDFTKYVSDEDIEAAKSRLAETLYKAVEEELKNEVGKKNDLADADYILLVGEDAISTGEVTINPIPAIEGENIDMFEISGFVTASGYCYSQSEMVDLLTQELLLKKSPQKKLIRVNEDTITYRIFDRDSVRSKIKITANIKGIEEFDIDPEKENGARLINKIKEHILGKDIEDAKNYIQNLPEVNKVEIESWPAWSPTVPTVPDNIDIEIRDAVMVE